MATSRIKRINANKVPSNFISTTFTEATEEERQAIDVEEGIKNGIFSFEGCRVKEPKLWEERYY